MPDPADTQPTLPLDPLPPPTQTAPAGRRRRWPWITAFVLVLVIALVAAGEFVARSLVDRSIRDRVIEALDLPENQQLDVQTSGFMLVQLALGRLDDVSVSSDSVTLGPFTGAVDAAARGVDLRGGPIEQASGTVRVDADQLTSLLTTGTDLPVDAIELFDSHITASGTIEVFGLGVPLSITLTPGADNGDITLTPISATVAGATLDLAALAERYGSVVGGTLDTQRVCIADRMPAGILLDDVTVANDLLTATFTVDGEIGVDPTLLEPGTCS